jgi:hypothetical protein
MLRPVRRKSRVLPLLVLVILVIVNAALIALLWPQRQVTVEPPGQLPPSPVESTDQKVMASTRLLVATSSKEAWRASVGECQKPGRVEHSDDGGRSWRQVVKPPLGPIVRLEVESSGNLYTIGGDDKDCSIRYISYSADGVVQTDKPRVAWSRDPNDPDQIQGPESAKATPCKDQRVVGLASLSTSEALVICTGGSVMVTPNSGKSWKKADQLVGTMAVGAGGGLYWVAGAGKNCDGISVRSLTFTEGELSRGRSGCAADLPVTPGGIAIGASGKAIWLWDGSEVRVSTDLGKTWQAR